MCAAVTYEIDDSLGAMGHCHCRMCQKAHGSAYATYVNVTASSFRFTKGEEFVSTYQSTESIQRTFCQVCGSNLQFRRAGKDRFGLAVGSLDSPLSALPDYEIWTSSIPDWSSREGIAEVWQCDHLDDDT